jgi:hypothetical protein
MVSYYVSVNMVFVGLWNLSVPISKEAQEAEIKELHTKLHAALAGRTPDI